MRITSIIHVLTVAACAAAFTLLMQHDDAGPVAAQDRTNRCPVKTVSDIEQRLKAAPARNLYVDSPSAGGLIGPYRITSNVYNIPADCDFRFQSSNITVEVSSLGVSAFRLSDDTIRFTMKNYLVTSKRIPAIKPARSEGTLL